MERVYKVQKEAPSVITKILEYHLSMLCGIPSLFLKKKNSIYTGVKPPPREYQLVSGLVHSLKWNHLLTERAFVIL